MVARQFNAVMHRILPVGFKLVGVAAEADDRAMMAALRRGGITFPPTADLLRGLTAGACEPE